MLCAMKLRMVFLIALMLVVPACGGAYAGAGDGLSAVTSLLPHQRTQAAMDDWMAALPRSLRSAVAMYGVGEHRVTLYVNGNTATARRRRVRGLCRHLAHTRIGDARRVLIVAEAFENARTLASVAVGGTCRIRRHG